MSLNMNVTTFETGAIRDHKPVPVRWDLMSAIALDSIMLATAEIDENCTWLEHVGNAIRTLLRFVGGEREGPMLEIAWWQLSAAVDRKELAPSEYQERAAMRQVVGAAGTSYSLLSYRALFHLAATYHEGKEKYGEWQWLYGFPLSTLISHALDHMWAITNADYTEDHWGHAFWNIMTAIHTYKTSPELCRGMPAGYYQMTDEIRQTLEKHREERRRYELGRERVDNGTNAPPEQWGSHPLHDAGVAVVTRSLRPDGQVLDPRSFNSAREAAGISPIERARGGPAPVPRQGFA